MNTKSQKLDHPGAQFRRFACTLAVVSALAWTTGVAAQGAYPNHPIKLVVGFPAGGASDVAARAVGTKLGTRLGQSVVIDNRPGAASNIGSELVAHSPPDGYTVLLGTISLAINPSLYPNLGYDALKDFAPVTEISSAPFLLVVNPSTPYKSISDLVTAAKSAKQPITFASAGSGSGAHLFMEYFASSAGVHLTHVPYKGAAPAMTDVLAGVVPMIFDNIITTLPLAKAGRVRALAVSTSKRSAAAPDIPTLNELGIRGFDASAWFGLFVPAGTPAEVIKRLNEETMATLKDPTVREQLLALGSDPIGSSPAEFGRFYRAEVEKWGKVVHAAGVKLE